MRRILFVFVALSLAGVGCGMQVEQGGEPQEGVTSQNNVVPPPPPSSPIFSCTATTNCATPFDGISRSCGGASCSAFADHVVCNGVTTFCTGSLIPGSAGSGPS